MSEEYKKVKSGKLKLKGDGSEEKRKAKKKAKKEKKARKRKLNEAKDEDEELHGGWYIVSYCSYPFLGLTVQNCELFIREFAAVAPSDLPKFSRLYKKLQKQIIFIFGDNLK